MEEKKSISPAVAIGVVVAILALAGFAIFRTVSSSGYEPSPGVPGVSAPGKPSNDGQVGPNGQKGPGGGAFYPTGPQGVQPGTVSGPPTVTGGPGR